MRTILLAALLCLSDALAQQPPPQGGTPVTFETVTARGATESLQGLLYKPQGASRAAVVLVHGSGGWTDAREGHYARALSAAGYTVLAIDAFGPRGVGTTVDDQSRVGSIQMTRDAFAARKYLVASGEDGSRTAVMGFSKGGTVSHFAADANFLPGQAERFQAAIPLYPACNARVRQPKPVTPMFMLLGEKDDYTGVKPCQALAADFEKAGGKVRVKVYPGASHAWDGNPRLLTSVRLPTAENYIDCFYDVEPDGSLVYMGKAYDRDDNAILTALRATCMKKGVTLWTNLTQKQRATEDIIAFLGESFPAR